MPERSVEQFDDIVPAEIADRLEVLNRMKRAGLYTGSGATIEQKRWVKERDGYHCQFAEYRGGSWMQCPRREDPDLIGLELKRQRGRQRWQLEVHHIYPQGFMRDNPVRHGGEQPTNLITLCAGLAGEIGHHDLLQPTMMIAKMMYRFDHTSYEKWIGYAHEAKKIEGMSTYNFEWDGMLKMVAKARTLTFLRESKKPFPYKRSSDERY